MARQPINHGTVAGDGTGESLFDAFGKVNANEAELYAMAVFYGALVSGEWVRCPPIFRLRLTGTGTVTLDSKDSLGNITLAVATYTATAATDQIEFPYAGDKAVAIRATLTGTTTAEVL